MANESTRTVYGSLLETFKELGIPFAMPALTTLNEKLGIQAGVAPATGVYPDMGYLCIGNGGITGSTGSDGSVLITPKIYKPTSASLYNMLPLVLRAVGNDLSPTEQANYALRRVETIGGASYIAYYLKRINMTGVTPQLTQTTVTSGVSTTVPFVPDSTALAPTPPTIPSDGVVYTSGNYVSAMAAVSIVFGPTDVTEFQNAIMIKYQNLNYATISEVGICSGVDKVVTVTDPGASSSFNMTEAIAVQINDFINVAAMLQFNNTGVTWSYSLGANSPLPL